MPAHVSGPSILGLGSSDEPDVGYLLDDELPRRHGGRFFAAMLLVALAVGTYIGYRQVWIEPAFAAPIPLADPPAFAYEHTPPPPMTVSEAVLPDKRLGDALALQNIAAEMRQQAERDKLTAARRALAKSTGPGGDMLKQGEDYLYGRGVEANCGKALHSLQQAAGDGNAAAMARLGTMYGSGRCVKFNRVKAYEWFAKSKNADPENAWLESSMDMLWRNMSSKERARILH